ncbi:hypothetical protein MHUMG1_09526 [Metarhizium humberi]|uniref:Peptidase M60 domain-containing protein n=1 Tax=Metarhizium humberi TaxID=2596975 RepID=A0A9P8M2T5_9HYPO|nr:hypothetical protein MHUMG1_09526 [Metarhizium humberi]
MQTNGLVLMKSNCVPVSLQDTPNVCSGNKQDAIGIWPKEEYAGRNELRHVNLDGVGQDVLDGLVPEEMAITRRTEAILALKSGQDSKAFYRAKRQAIWPEVWNKGPRKADKIVLESPDLRQWNISITEVYAYCPGTNAGSPRIRCEWIDKDKGFNAWSKITLALGATSSSRIVLPLTLTSYVKDAGSVSLRQSDSKIFTHEWTVRLPPVYKQTNTSIFPQPRAITVHAAPVAEQERARLRQQMKWADFQPTGFYLNPETPLTITASGIDTNQLKPEILVGTPALVHPDRRDEEMPAQLEALKPLKNGANTISSPLGGIIYIRYVKQAGQSRRPIAVSLGNTAQPFPLFRQGVTTDSQWKAMLRATKVPFAEQSGEHVIITGLAADAKIHADKGQEQQALLSTYTDMIGAQDKISGLSTAEPNPRDRPSSLRPMVVQTRNDVYPNSWHYRAAIPSQYHDEVWWHPSVRKSWMIWHELGHHRQQTDTWSWEAVVESTVNIYSLAVGRSLGLPDRPVKEWNAAKKYLAQAPSKKVFDDADAFIQLVMLEQVRVAFGGDRFYHEMHKRSRAGRIQSGDANIKHYFMTLAAQIAGKNLSDYFTKWGLKPEPRTLKEMSKYPPPPRDYTTVPVYGGR